MNFKIQFQLFLDSKPIVLFKNIINMSISKLVNCVGMKQLLVISLWTNKVSFWLLEMV